MGHLVHSRGGQMEVATLECLCFPRTPGQCAIQQQPPQTQQWQRPLNRWPTPRNSKKGFTEAPGTPQISPIQCPVSCLWPSGTYGKRLPPISSTGPVSEPQRWTQAGRRDYATLWSQ